MKALKALDDSEDSDYHGSDGSSSESEVSDSPSENEEDSSSDSGKGSEKSKPLCRRSLKFQHPLPSKKKCKDTNYVRS